MTLTSLLEPEEKHLELNPAAVAASSFRDCLQICWSRPEESWSA